MSGAVGPWRRHAGQWRRGGAPLLPCGADLRATVSALARWQAEVGRSAPRALLPGVTPEPATRRWSPGTLLLAVDRALPMTLAVWPGGGDSRAVLCADWRLLPLADHVIDVAVGDGSLDALPGGAAVAEPLAALRRVLRPGGLLVLRVFERPDSPEPLALIAAAVGAGRTPNLHVLEWRPAMAVHGGLAERAVLADAWRAWREAVASPQTLCDRHGWRPELLGTVDAYRDMPMRCVFPTAAEPAAAFCAADVEVLARAVPGYELGERCPTSRLRAAGGS